MGAGGEHDSTAPWLEHSHGGGRTVREVSFLKT